MSNANTLSVRCQARNLIGLMVIWSALFMTLACGGPTPQDCTADEVFVEDACLECGANDECIVEGGCTEPCDDGDITCVDGARVEICG